MYFLYKHIREDKNEVFYIGIGTVDEKSNTYIGKHYRAFNKKKSRNNHWKSIVAKTTYRIEIPYLTPDIEEIQRKEIEFISLYKDTLCNQTAGGHGIKSYRHSEETKRLISKSLKGVKKSKSHTLNINKRKPKAIRMFNDSESYNFNSLTEAAEYLGSRGLVSNISRYIKYKKSKVCGYRFEEITEVEDKEPLR